MKARTAAAAVAMFFAAAAAVSAAEKGSDSSYTFAVGPFTPEYAAPAAGSYELPAIDTVRDHPLVDASGAKTTLAKILGGRLAVVSFIYGTCSEAEGCPMSTAVLHRLDQRLAAEPALASRVSLLTISFDPERDTPERLAAMQAQRADGSTWRFAGGADETSLAELLDDFGQSISKLRRADGSWTGTYRHVLKVYLLDRRMQVRNIYSVGFLNPELVENDLKTLAAGDAR